MLNPNFAIYIGEEQEAGFTGFICQNGLFCVLKVETGLSKEEGRIIQKKLAGGLEYTQVENLNDFESYLSDNWKNSGLPTGFSFAAILLKNNLAFLKTIDLGEIYLRRGSQFTKLIEGNNSASGYLEDSDLIILATKDIDRLLGESGDLKKIIASNDPKQMVDNLTSTISMDQSKGAIALFISFEKEMIGGADEELRDISGENKNEILNKLKEFVAAQDKKRLMAFIVVTVLLLIFFWNIILGYQKRSSAQKEKKIQTTKELITEKLHQAEDVASLNLQRTIALINESKQDLANLKKEINDNGNKDIVFLDKLIKNEELKILKEEEKASQEYFDLSVEDKKASGQKMFLQKDSVAILDPSGAVYILSLSKKSINKKTSVDIRGAFSVGLNEEGIAFFYKKNDGIFQISSDNKTKKIIDNDSDWGNIIDMVLYNGNVYLLDKGKNQIYKYLASENGFSQKGQYFKTGGEVDLNNATSFAIDASVYISLSNKIVKYTSGVADEFSNTFPGQDINIIKVITNADLEKVFGWDKSRGVIYTLSKSGDYERQIKSSVLAKASDVVVFENNAYALVGPKIYKINLD